MRSDPLRFMKSLVARFGDITTHHADGEVVVLLSRPDFARQVLRDNAANYSKERTPDDAMLRPLLGNGLLTSSGADWERQRRMFAPAFRRTEVERFDEIIVTAAVGLANRWRSGGPEQGPVRVDHELTGLTLNVLVKAILGIDFTGVGAGFGSAVDAINSFIGHFVPDSGQDPADIERRRRGFLRAKAFLDAVITMIISARQATDGHGGDLLASMLATGEDMPGSELRDHVLTMVMAGHETTAKALTWTLYLLDQHPSVSEVVRAEVTDVLMGRLPTAADVPHLEHCRRAVTEAIRLYPPVWLISRRAISADVIGGYQIPARSLVCISPYLLHRDPRYWDDPASYRPERFAPGGPADRMSHLYLPFGGGPRVCIGQHLAMTEAVLVLATLLQRVRLTLVPGSEVEPEALVTLRPRNGLLMTPTAP